MNRMKEVAKLLGVRLDEFFEVSVVGNPQLRCICRLTHSGLDIMCPPDAWWDTRPTLLRLLLGKDEIIKKPYNPFPDQSYCYIGIDGRVEEAVCDADVLDMMYYKIGNCFRTREEVTQEIIDKYVKWFNNDKQIEITEDRKV